jgi:AmmeMemoRadiSam system protein A
MTEVAAIEAEREALLDAARDAIDAAVRGRLPRPGVSEEDPVLLSAGAAFVTLRSPDGSLRGCIGELEARRPLIESVRGCAAGAALRDPRFPPVTGDEVAGLRLGISVLTPSRRVRGPDEIEVGRHGLIIERGYHRGVLLPEVATEQGWDVPTFLAQTCHKAGLPIDAWRDPATAISVFETVKLSD